VAQAGDGRRFHRECELQGICAHGDRQLVDRRGRKLHASA
jgi:hypothetical protein